MAYTVNRNTEFITYEVQDNDTYESIAAANNISLKELAILNGLELFDMKTIYAGSILKVGIRNATSKDINRTPTPLDNFVENIFYQASLQSVSVDTATQAALDEIKEEYNRTGKISSITKPLSFLINEKGYTTEEVKLLLNDYSDGLDLGFFDEIGLDVALDKAEKGKYSESGYDDADYTKDTILGLPFRYNTYADPRKRVYNGTFLTDAPIVSIIPGKPLFRGATNDDGGLGSIINELFGNDNDDDSILNKTGSIFGLNDNDEDSILEWLKKSQKNNENNGDLRYYRFKEDYKTFEKYLDINIATLSAKMGIGSLKQARYTNYMKSPNSGSPFDITRAMKFYCTKSGTSSSESVSNSYEDSQIASTMNGVSDAVNELHYLTGGALKNNSNLMGAADKLLTSTEEILGSLSETIIGNDSLKGSLGQMGGAMKSAVAGNKIIWPQIWKNSTFSRQYNLSFEFVSPYGNPEAIFRYVYLPFLVLLTLAMPKQYGTSGYSNPFLIRLEMPGYFTSDLAVIENMSWRKGGNDSLFTNDGLPLAITVDITVKDLYPNMMMSENWKQLRHNTGMHGFLDNMAGLSVERFTPWLNLKTAMLAKVSNVLGNVERNTIGDFKSRIYSITKSNPLFGSAINQ